MTYRIAIGGIRYETNSFAAGRATYEDFAHHYIREGPLVLDPGANTEVRGACEAAEELGVELVGTLDTFGGCGPPVEDRAYRRLKTALLERITVILESVQAVYIPLHGAMTTELCDDVEGDLVQAVRDLVGSEMFLVVSHDLHGAPSGRLVEACNALIGYKTCPHVDFEATGRKAVQLAARVLRSGERVTTTRQVVPVLTPAEVHDTNVGPAASLANEAAELARSEELEDVTLFMCQPWLDTSRTSWAVTIVSTGNRQHVASRVAREVAQSIWSARDAFTVAKHTVAEAVQLLSRLPEADTPYLLADSGDSPSAGSTGDSTDLLGALIAIEHPGRVLTTVVDPEAARRLGDIPIGTRVELSVGGALSPALSRPVLLKGALSWHGQGRYHSGYPAGPVDIGAIAVVEVGKCSVVVTERPAMMLDPALYLHVGLDPRSAFAVQVKSAGGFRALWAPVSERILVVATRGASDGELDRLPFAHIPRPLWPFDTDFEFAGAEHG